MPRRPGALKSSSVPGVSLLPMPSLGLEVANIDSSSTSSTTMAGLIYSFFIIRRFFVYPRMAHAIRGCLLIDYFLAVDNIERASLGFQHAAAMEVVDDS